MRIRTNTFHCVFFFLFFTFSTLAQKPLRIAIVSENNDRGNGSDWFFEGVKKEVNTLLDSRFEISYETRFGNFSPQIITAHYDDVFNDPNIDIVIGMGSLSSGILAKRGTYEKPTIAGIIINYELQKIPYSNGTSQLHNFTYVQSPFDIARDLKKLYQFKAYKKVGIIGDNHLVDNLPFLDDMLGKNHW